LTYHNVHDFPRGEVSVKVGANGIWALTGKQTPALAWEARNVQ